MHPRNFLGVMLTAGILAGCGVAPEGEEQVQDDAVRSASDVCDGTTAWEYYYYADPSMSGEPTGVVICKCRGVIQTWGDTTPTPYYYYWSGLCGGGEAAH
ncbi:hypothetical protein SAMN05443572_101695 [Myxococcus fulvus]|uniref:Lipoprotein n=1 Tax=Myxococcus fulvus TaxID=33 RepID=A0A511SW32_MYXFU|nr:hypothetical protein [Myxococcus fulvus]AKF84773.1 hypothetical protein MFUL124B02_04395 [Myxococcus fulvus 124B02]GEN05757.1 hypothetical protein MFU01_07940 [Myxococcus fulvus]SES96132.1 hypothetical protein SAMN05443572_101695 [Myxococcus fulvus]